MNRKVARRSIDVTDPAAPDGIGPGRAGQGGADRPGADRVEADHAPPEAGHLPPDQGATADLIETDQRGTDRGGADRAGADRGRADRDARRWRRRVALVLTWLILMLAPVFVARIYVIPSGSMETTLHGCPDCDNDRVLVDKLAYRFSAPTPGDIAVFTLPDTWTSTELRIPHGGGNPVAKAVARLGSLVGLQTADETEYIKRVIAIGGQTVACCDDRNRILVDGVALDEPYIYFQPQAGAPQQAPFGPVRVPEGHLWMMGDSRNDSIDSRAEGNGPVPLTNVIGKARIIVYPFDRLGAIPAPPAR